MFYLQTNTLKKTAISGAGKEHERIFNYVKYIKLYPLTDRAEKKVFYDKDLKMHFESANFYRKYEIEVANVFVEFDIESKKAQDFQRRLNYKYDWIQAEVCSNGSIISIKNLEELRFNWTMLRKKLEDDYVGIYVADYLEKISNQFSDEDHFKIVFIQYFEYALLFPNIPQRHSDTWQMERKIYLDNSLESQAVEVMCFDNEDAELKTYNLRTEQIPDNKRINIMYADGKVKLNKNDGLVQEYNVKVGYTYDDAIMNEWVFNMERVVEPKND